MKLLYPRGSSYHTCDTMGARREVHESQELSRMNHCRQLLGYTFYQSLRAAAAAVSVLVISLHAEGMWTSAMTDCITHNCLTGLNLQVCYQDTSWAAMWREGGSCDHVVVSWKKASTDLRFSGLYSIPWRKACYPFAKPC